MESLWGTTDLEHLHHRMAVNLGNYVEKVRFFQSQCDIHVDEIREILFRYLEEVVEPQVGKAVYVQSSPTFRAHFSVELINSIEHELLAGTLDTRGFLERFYWCANEQSARGFHRDAQYGLPKHAVNIWTALTDSYGTNSLWVGDASDEGVNSSRPVEVSRNSCFIFNGATRWHGTVCNTSGHTRISFDLRVLTR